MNSSEWINHDGKSMPVDPAALVYVEFQDGTSDDKANLAIKASWWHGTGELGNSNWLWNGDKINSWNIVRYKIIASG